VDVVAWIDWMVELKKDWCWCTTKMKVRVFE
jgi:hypothetical protein